VAGESVGRVEVTPGRPREDALIVTHARGPVSVTLVALDRSLARGETRAELSGPTVFPDLAAGVPVTLALLPDALAHYGHAATRLGLRAYSPGFEKDLLRLATDSSTSRVALGFGRLPRGRTILRLRQTDGDSGTAWNILVTPRTDAAALVIPIFRLVARAAA